MDYPVAGPDRRAARLRLPSWNRIWLPNASDWAWGRSLPCCRRFRPRCSLPCNRPPKLLRGCRQRVAEADQAAAAANETAQSLAQQIESALAARGQSDLAAAMDRAGGLVSQFRRRVQLDERLDQLGRYQAELEERGRQLIDRQMLPVGVLVGLGAVFVVGVMLVLAGLLMPTSITGSVGWALAVLGLAGSGAAAAGKVLLERSNSRQLDGCQKQLGVLQLQVEQAKADRDALDGQLPHGGGPIPSRLQAAEKELAALEELTPLDTRRSAARQEAEAAARRAAGAKEELKAARRRWRQALSMLGLPEDLSLQQVSGLRQRGDRIAETQRRLGQLREDLLRRQRELDGLTARIGQLAADAGVALGPAGPIEQLRQLAEAAAEQEASAARRDAIRSASAAHPHRPGQARRGHQPAETSSPRAVFRGRRQGRAGVSPAGAASCSGRRARPRARGDRPGNPEGGRGGRLSRDRHPAAVGGPGDRHAGSPPR